LYTFSKHRVIAPWRRRRDSANRKKGAPIKNAPYNLIGWNFGGTKPIFLNFSSGLGFYIGQSNGDAAKRKRGD
jgi:hypothetical protein